MMRSTSRPAISPASLVAWRCASSKYAGTVMTAWLTGLAEVALGVALQLHQDAGADLLGVVRLAVDVDLPVGAHVALHRPDRAIGVGDRLALGDLADEHLAGLRERDDRGRRAGALGVGDDGGLARLEHRDDGVGGAEIDADGLGHGSSLMDAFGVSRSDRTGRDLRLE